LPMAALVWFTCREEVMGAYKSGLVMIVVAGTSALAVLALNTILLLQTFGVNLPGLPA
jgi:manganese transport protein